MMMNLSARSPAPEPLLAVSLPVFNDTVELIETVRLLPHVVKRYRQRVQPDLGWGPAKRQLKEELVQDGKLTIHPPAWLTTTTTGAWQHTDAWLTTATYTLPLHSPDHDPRGDGRWVAVTCLTAGWVAKSIPSPQAQAWAQRREQARELHSWLVLSPRVVRHYARQRDADISPHADLVELAQDGVLQTQAPSWLHRPKSAYANGPFLLLADGQTALGLRELSAGRYEAVAFLDAQHEPTARQQGHSARTLRSERGRQPANKSVNADTKSD